MTIPLSNLSQFEHKYNKIVYIITLNQDIEISMGRQAAKKSRMRAERSTLNVAVSMLLFINIFLLILLAAPDRTNIIAWIAGAIVGTLGAAFAYVQILPQMKQWRNLDISRPSVGIPLSTLLSVLIVISTVLLINPFTIYAPPVAIMFLVDTSGAMNEKVNNSQTRFDIAQEVINELASRPALDQPQNWRGLRVMRGGDCSPNNTRLVVGKMGLSSEELLTAFNSLRSPLSGFTSYRPGLRDAVTDLTNIQWAKDAGNRMIVMLLSSLDQGECGDANSLTNELKEIYELYSVGTLVCTYTIGADTQDIAVINDKFSTLKNSCYEDARESAIIIGSVERQYTALSGVKGNFGANELPTLFVPKSSSTFIPISTQEAVVSATMISNDIMTPAPTETPTLEIVDTVGTQNAITLVYESIIASVTRDAATREAVLTQDALGTPLDLTATARSLLTVTPTPAFNDPRSQECQSSVSAPQGWTRTHVIASGDRLFQLAGRYGTSVAELMSVNCLTDDRIFPNQILLVP